MKINKQKPIYQKEPSMEEKLEHIGPLIIGSIEIVIGFVLTVIPDLTKVPEWLKHLLPHVGIGLIAAGVLTATLERIARKKLQHDIEEIRGAHFETMLKGLMPESIFKQVQEQIIRQPFIRKNFHVTIELSWHEGNEYLTKSQTSSFEVENVAHTLQRFEIRTFEEQMYEDRFPNSAHIQSVRIQLEGTGKIEEYSNDSLKHFCKATGQVVEARIPILIQPRQTAKVSIHTNNIFENRDIYTHVVVNPTDRLDLTVVHPENLSVMGTPLHPSPEAFIEEMNAPTVKRWRIEAGLLPFQGIEVTWRPRS